MHRKIEVIIPGSDKCGHAVHVPHKIYGVIDPAFQEGEHRRCIGCNQVEIVVSVNPELRASERSIA